MSANVSTVDLLCHVTCLGVTIDQELSFANYVRRLSGQCFYWLRQIRVIRRSLTTDTIKALVNARTVNRIDYCNAVFAGVHDIHLRSCKESLTPQLD